VQFTPPLVGGGSHRPGLLPDTGAPFGAVQMPVQHSAATKHWSLVWMQYDDARSQTWSVGSQRPEQHWLLLVQALLAVVQPPVTTPPSGVEPIGAHLPFTQSFVQQTLPETGHDAPTLRHWLAPQKPPTQAPVQQSRLLLQPAPEPPHVVIDGTQT
jgi:hypothetical protein